MRIAAGDFEQVAQAARRAHADGDPAQLVLVFDDQTGGAIDIDLRSAPSAATEYEASARSHPNDFAPASLTPAWGDSGTNRTIQLAEHAPEARRGPGRPRLGVVAREVTLLPRHWEWLRQQPGGASVALRKLVEEAHQTHAGRDRVRASQEAAYRFMSAMAGDEAGFEEAARALFAANLQGFDEQTTSWPADVRDYASRLAAGAFSPNG